MQEEKNMRVKLNSPIFMAMSCGYFNYPHLPPAHNRIPKQIPKPKATEANQSPKKEQTELHLV
jgi:hypothetical protein